MRRGEFDKLFLSYFHGMLASAYLTFEGYGAAKDAAEQALEMVDQFGEECGRGR